MKQQDLGLNLSEWRTRGFGVCYLYLRNVKGFQWNHKRVYSIYRELELNLRIKPRKRLVCDKPVFVNKVVRFSKPLWPMCPVCPHAHAVG